MNDTALNVTTTSDISPPSNIARKIWILTTCVPFDQQPCLPEAFSDATAALAAFDRRMREEWQYHGPLDDDCGRQPYPGNPYSAHEMMVAEDNDIQGTWGHWQLTAHIVGGDGRELTTSRGCRIDDPESYNRHRIALEVQDAVNLRALAREFVKIVDQASAEAKSATWADPAVVLFVNKLESLCRSADKFNEAYAVCKDRANSTQSPN
jgi:hypothetical protein